MGHVLVTEDHECKVAECVTHWLPRMRYEMHRVITLIRSPQDQRILALSYTKCSCSQD